MEELTHYYIFPDDLKDGGEFKVNEKLEAFKPIRKFSQISLPL